jgi:hypothetical protein
VDRLRRSPSLRIPLNDSAQEERKRIDQPDPVLRFDVAMTNYTMSSFMMNIKTTPLLALEINDDHTVDWHFNFRPGRIFAT